VEVAIEQMGYDNLRVNSPFPLIQLQDLTFIRKVNDHAKLIYTGLVPAEAADGYVEQAGSRELVELIREIGGGERVLFRGIVTKVGVKRVLDNAFLTVEALSHTFDLDIKLWSASFQNQEQTYAQLFRKVLADFPHADFIDNASNDAKPGRFILAYQETRWEFLKRLASHFSAVLVPDPTAAAPKFWVGLPEGREGRLGDIPYIVAKDLSSYLTASQNHDPKLTEADCTGYLVESSSYLDLGDAVVFQGKELRVAQAVASLSKGEFKLSYLLLPAQGIRQNLHRNPKLSGASLSGVVLDRDKDRVRLHLEVDPEQKKEEACWFPYASAYTAEGNSGWYFMPEVGDTVRLYFPDAAEEHGLVIAAVRQGGSDNAKFADPNIKYLGNAYGKELMMAGSELSLTANSKDSQLVLRMKLDDGIEVKSDKELVFRSDKDIVLDAGQKLELTAGERIYLNCRSSSVILDGKVDIRGNTVTLQPTGPKAKQASQPAQPAYESASPEPVAEDDTTETLLDFLQLCLDIAGFIPVVGAVFDLANAGVSTLRGDFTGAALSCLAAIPGIGDAAAGVKLGVKAARSGAKLSRATKVAKRAHTAAKMMKAAKTAKTVKAGSKLTTAGKLLRGSAKLGLAGFTGYSAWQNIEQAGNLYAQGEYIKAARCLVNAAGGAVALTSARRCKSNISAVETADDLAKQANKNARRIRHRPKRKTFRNKNPKHVKCDPEFGEPVDAVTGEVVAHQQDFSIQGRIPIAWGRHYGSQNQRIGLCGRGWETPADARLELNSDGTVVFHHGNGIASYFSRLPGKSPVTEPVDGGILARTDRHYTLRLKEGLVYHFPLVPPQTKEIKVELITDLSGNSWQFVREQDGLKEIRESTGRRLRITSADGLIRRIELILPYHDPRLLVRYEYDQDKNLTAVYDALGAPYRFAYEKNLLVQHTDRNGLSFNYKYDKYGPGGRCVHSWGDGKLYDYRFVYRTEERVTEITDSLGNVSYLKYDESQMVVEEVDALGGVIRYEYDDEGRTTAVIDQDGRRTEYGYDRYGNLVSLIRPDGQKLTVTYDTEHRPVAITDFDGTCWRQEWDDCGRLVKRISPLGMEFRYEYDEFGQPVGFIDPAGAKTTLEFDKWGNPVRLSDALGHSTELAYDVLGRVTERLEPLNRRTVFMYDQKGRLVRVKKPDGSELCYAYDAEDNLVTYTDENGAVTKLEYCGVSELKRRIQPGGQVVEYHYDTEERLVALTNQRGERYELERDALGRIIGETDYWGQKRRYEYTPAGDLLMSTDPLGRVIRYKTDTLGRIVEKACVGPEDAADVAVERFEYDVAGNLTACQNEAIRIERKYDREGRLVEEAQGDWAVIRYDYDLLGKLTSRTTKVTKGEAVQTQTVKYAYDVLGRVNAIELPGHEPIQLVRDAAGRITKEILTGSLSRYLEYDKVGCLTGQMVLNGEGVLFKQEYEYDRAGNLLTKLDSVFGKEMFRYDPVGRLITHFEPEGEVRRYLHDPAGDLLKTEVRSEDEVWSREGEYAGIRYVFDRVGNLVERAGNQDKTEFVWDANGRLVESVSDGKKTSYQYDPLGRRISKETDGVVTRFYWDGDALLGDVTGDDIREWVYYPGSFEPLAMLVTDTTCKDNEASERIYYYANDPNGCPTRLLDETGKVVWAALYDAWGKVKKLPVDLVEQPIRLQGQYFDAETGLYYNRWRYYCPENGSFVSQDPLGLMAGENIYGFGPNAQMWVDPLGLECKMGGVKSELPERNGALNQAKRDANILRSKQPDKIVKVKMTEAKSRGGHVIKDTDGKIIEIREYHYTNRFNEKVIIQEHSAPHIGSDGPHFNVRPISDTRNGVFPGTKDHYPFKLK